MKFCLLIFVFLLSVNAQTLEKVSLQLSWLDQFQFAGYYVAKEKGFYKDVGLEVDIKQFSFGIDKVEDVITKKTDFSIGRESLIMNEKNSDLVALYALFQASPLMLISTKESNINNITEFSNKRIMATSGDAMEVSINAMIKSQDVKLDTLKFIKHTHNINDLIENKTDLISAYTSKAPFILDKNGIKYNIFHPKDYGFDMYSDFLYTRKNMLSSKEKTVKAFTDASLRGWKYAYDNIEESVDIILAKYNSQNLTKEELIFEAEELKKLSYYKTNELGEININKVQRIYDLYNVMGFIKNKIDINKFTFYEKYLDDKNGFNLSFEEREYLQNKKEIKVCANSTSKPYIEINEDGKSSGMISDIFDIVQEKTGLKFSLVETKKWNDNFEFIKEKKCDMLFYAADTDKRREYLNFTKPYINIPYVIVTNLEKGYISDIDQVKGEKLSLLKGDAYSEILKSKYPNIDIITANTTLDNLALIKNKQVFGYIGTLPTISYKMQSDGIIDLKIAGSLKQSVGLSIGTRKDEPLLNSVMEKAIATVSESEKSKIYNSWNPINIEPKVDYDLIIKIFAFFFILLLIWSYIHFKLSKLNKKLENSLYNFEYLFHHTIEAIILFQDNKCVNINKAALVLFKFSTKDEAIAKIDSEFIQNYDTQKEMDKNEQTYEINAIKQDGTIFPILVKNKFTYIDDKLTKIVLCVDLTELKNSENIIIQQSKITAIGEMLGNIAHQWRQPLSTISMSVTNMRATLELEEELSKDEILNTTKSISNQCQYLSKTIDDFRSFLISDKDLVSKVDLSNSMLKVENLISDAYKSSSIKIINDLENCEINVNESKFLQAVINIFNNSNDVMKQKNIKNEDRYVFVSCKDKNNYVELSILDSGGGIEDKYIGKIFEPYFSTKLDLNGTGIGLYITHQIITIHLGGKINVENFIFQNEGKNVKGAKFTIKLYK